MTVRVKLFAIVRDLVKADEISVELPQGATLADLRVKLLEAHPTLESVLSHVMIAVDSQYAAQDQTLSEHSEVALIPPVSGG